MKLLDLFSGIGGFSLAARWMGWETVGFVEWDKFTQRVLRKNFPGKPVWGDIRNFDKDTYDRYYFEHKGELFPPLPTLITGGFPCQPFSKAGKQQGVKDDRNLWPEILRVIKEFRPAWVVAENVANLVSMVEPEYSISLEGTATKIGETGQEIWTEKSKYIIESICEDFERAEYQVETVIIPALSVGARHRRDRLWFIAHTDSHNQTPLSRRILSSIEKETALSEEKQGRDKPAVFNNRLSDLSGDLEKSLKSRGDFRHLLRTTEPPVCGANDGIPYRMDGLKLSASQYNESQLKSLGNAIVPHVAFEIYQAIEKANEKYNLHI